MEKEAVKVKVSAIHVENFDILLEIALIKVKVVVKLLLLLPGVSLLGPGAKVEEKAEIKEEEIIKAKVKVRPDRKEDAGSAEETIMRKTVLRLRIH